MNVDIYPLAVLVLIGVGMLIGSYTIIGVAAFLKSNGNGVKTFGELLGFEGSLKIITVGWIVIAIAFLALAGVINEPAVVAIMSGIAGYVLGGVGKSKDVERLQLPENNSITKSSKITSVETAKFTSNTETSEESQLELEKLS